MFHAVPNVDFLVKIQDVTAEEREDAVFECVLSHPMTKMTWMGKNVALEQGDKYDISVSEDMLIHKLVVKDCMPLDKGIYAAVAGLTSCSAWLIVEGMFLTYFRDFTHIHIQSDHKNSNHAVVQFKATVNYQYYLVKMDF